MKIGYIEGEAARTVIEKTRDITLGITEDVKALMVEDAMIGSHPDLPALNTSDAIRALLSNKELIDTFKTAYNIVPGYPSTHLYGFIGSKQSSDFIEMTSSTRFLTGDIGPQVGFVQGVGIACNSDVYMALPALPALVEGIIAMGYRGEITIGLTEEFHICNVLFGHFTGGFTLYNELIHGNIQDSIEWCLDVGAPAKLHRNGVSVTTLLSYPPFPQDPTTGYSIKAPSSAEKHLYRCSRGLAEVAYSAAWGKDIFEAKRRCRKTIENCAAYNKDIQHRIDYGNRQSFVLNQDRWLTFGGS